MVDIGRYYAKSNPLQSLKEHTDFSISNYEILKKHRKRDIDSLLHSWEVISPGVFWDLLLTACRYHDIGKVHTPFQQKIIESYNRYAKDNQKVRQLFSDVPELPHNMLSPLFLKGAVRQLEEKYANTWTKEYEKILFETILLHHKQDNLAENIKDIFTVIDVIEKDIFPQEKKIKEYFSGFKIDLYDIYNEYIPKLEFDFKEINKNNLLLLLLGLLERIDHSASNIFTTNGYLNFIEVEKPIINLSDFINEKFKNEKKQKMNFQATAAERSDKDILAIVSTGLGKSYMSDLWIGKDKGFITLPMRTSVNAAYVKKVKDYGKNAVGLLHSSSSSYIFSKQLELGVENPLVDLETAKAFSFPVTVSTIDQLFAAVLGYKGFEKVFATLSYSKVVIDEIQAYDPKIFACLLLGIKELRKLGSKFCIMTATLPNIYKSYLIDHLGISNEDIITEKSHYRKNKIELVKKPLSVVAKEIIKEKTDKNILIIANTIKMANLVKKELDDLIKEDERLPSINLLTTLFMSRDRRKKELNLETEKGIWITTQIAEVSLDIDYDILITEISSIDSQIQRWGRIFRHRNENYHQTDPNIYISCIFEEEGESFYSSDKGNIYDPVIVDKTIQCLSERQRLLSDEDKDQLICDIYNDATYYSDFQVKVKKYLSNIELLKNDFTLKKNEAHRLFRCIYNIDGIPLSSLEDEDRKKLLENIQLIRKKETNREDKQRAFSEISDLTISVPYYKIQGKYSMFTEPFSFLNKLGIVMLGMGYNFNTGLNIDVNNID